MQQAQVYPTQFDPKEPVFSIGITAQKIGVSPETWRLYEREGLVLPFKTKTRRRLYSQNDIEWITRIRRQIREQKLNIAGLKRLLALVPCWEIKPCTQEEMAHCPASTSQKQLCWEIEAVEKICQNTDYRTCRVYLNADQVSNLKDYYTVTQKF